MLNLLNLDGDLYLINLAGQPLILQRTNYMLDQFYADQAEAAKAATEAVSAHKLGPTAICLYSLDSGEPFATLSLKTYLSSLLPEGACYVKHYSENASIFRQMLEANLIELVEGYPAVQAGFAGLVFPYRLTNSAISQPLVAQPVASSSNINTSEIIPSEAQTWAKLLEELARIVATPPVYCRIIRDDKKIIHDEACRSRQSADDFGKRFCGEHGKGYSFEIFE